MTVKKNQNAITMKEEAPNYDEIDRFEIERLIVDDLGCGSPQDARFQLDRIIRLWRANMEELNQLKEDIDWILAPDPCCPNKTEYGMKVWNAINQFPGVGKKV